MKIYYVENIINGQYIEKEVSLKEYCKAERSAGFQPKMSSDHPDYMTTPATGGFSTSDGLFWSVKYKESDNMYEATDTFGLDSSIELHEMIEDYVDDRRVGDHDSFAPVKDGDISKLNLIIGKLLEMKYDKDGDGNLPVSYVVIDRHKRTMVPNTSIINDDPLLQINTLSALGAWCSGEINNITSELRDEYPKPK